MTQTARYIEASPGRELIIPEDVALTLAPDLWKDVRVGCWAFGNDPMPRDLIRPNHYMRPVGANAIFKTGQLGRGFSNASPTTTTSYWKYAKDGGGDETERIARMLDAQVADLGFTIEILFEPETTGSQSLLTTSQHFSVYSGMDITMATNVFVNLGDGTGQLSSDRISSQSNTQVEAGKVNYWAISMNSCTNENAWRHVLNHNESTGQNGALGTGTTGVRYSGSATFNNLALTVLGRSFITNNFTGKLYGFNIIQRYMTHKELQDRNTRILDMFTLAPTRELFSTGFLNLRNTGPAPQAQSLS